MTLVRSVTKIDSRHYLPGGRENGGGIGRLVGYIVDEVSTKGGSQFIVDTRGPKLSLVESPFRLLIAILILLRDRVFAHGRLQHIHVAGRGSTIRKLVLTAVARAIGSLYILHLHDPEYADDVARRPAVLRDAIGRMFRGADAVVVLGTRDREVMERLLEVDPRRIAVLHNAVPDPKPTLSFGRSPEAPVRILFLGRLSERKGVPELLDALASERMRNLAWRAVLAGDGPVETFRQRACARGIGDRVAMPGWVGEAEVRALCAQSEILVLPSHAEAMAMAVLEGMASALTVVTTRVGAHEEVLTHDDTGVFVPVGDPLALADALVALILDPARRKRLARRAREHFVERLSIAAYAERLERVYAAVRAGRQTPCVVASWLGSTTSADSPPEAPISGPSGPADLLHTKQSL